MEYQRPRRRTSRAGAKAVAQQPAPLEGKALARIRYFETQRGLAPTERVQGRIRSAAAPIDPLIASARAAPSTQRRLYFAAARARAALEPSAAMAASTPLWQPLGPSFIPKGQTYGTGGNNRPPVSGRTVGIVVHAGVPDRLILCSAGGGLWRSDDAGATWSPVTDDQPTLSMGAICAAPGARHIIYAATGEGDTRSRLGVGLLRSTDGGATWTHLPSPHLADVGIYDLAVDPRDANRVWAGTVNKLLESTDSGATWKVRLTRMTWDISINPTDPKEIFAATNGGLMRSVDDGATWNPVNLPGAPAAPYERMEVCHAPSNGGVVYVFATKDTGNTISGGFWRRPQTTGAFVAQPLPAGIKLSQSWYDWCASVAPDDPNQVYLGAIDLYRGQLHAGTWAWTNISSRSSGDSIHPDQHHIEFDPRNPKILYVCNDGGLFRSPDKGASWVSLNKGLAITEFEFLARMSARPNWVIGGTQDNGTHALATGGTWHQIAFGDGGDCGVDDLSPASAFHSYYGMPIEKVAATSATGPNIAPWLNVSPPAPAGYRALFYPPMDVAGRLVAKAGESVFVSANGGTTWNNVPLPPFAGPNGPVPNIATALTIVSATCVLVASYRGQIFRIDRKTGWPTAQAVLLGQPRVGAVSDIVSMDNAGQTLWVTYSAFGGRHVYLSQNGGGTWTDRSGNLPDIPINALVVDPANTNTLYAASDHGVYRSQDGGTTWLDFSNGLPHAIVGDLIFHAGQRLLLAGTRSRGAWQVAI